LLHPLMSRIGRMQLSTASFVSLAVMMTFVVGGNGQPIWWSGLPPSLIVGPTVIVLQCASSERSWPIRTELMLVPALLAAGCLASFLSLVLTDPTLESAVVWASSYLSPVIVFAAVFACRLDERRSGRLLTVISLAATIPMLRGLVEFYRAWGIPTGEEYLLARYDVVRMAGYMRATFGNTGNTAAYLSLIFPMLVSACLRVSQTTRLKWLFRTMLLIAGINVLIVQSRTLFLVLIPSLLTVMYVQRLRFRRALSLFVLAVAAVTLPALATLDQLLERTVGVVGGSESDQSAFQRVEAIQFGWRLMVDNIAVGVGPGRSLGLNPFTSAHQFWVQQGAELGGFGLVWSMLLSLVVVGACAHLAQRARKRPGVELQFTFIIGPATFLLYGAIANMALAQSVVNAWVGLMAACLAVAATPLLARSNAGAQERAAL
jgi:hypothetical protein